MNKSDPILAGVKSIHITGVSGVVTSQLAILLCELGFKVTGSDRAVYPPASTFLKKYEMKINLGFKEEHVRYRPDLIVAMAFVTKDNPEIVYADKHNIPVVGYAELVGELIKKEESVVIVGDHGKTSISALAGWLLEVWGKKPNLLIGGFPKNMEVGVRVTSSNYSVMEGDEYPVLAWKKVPKFSYYNPKYLIISDIHWDHRGIYKTEQEYYSVFRELIKKMPINGTVIASEASKMRVAPLLSLSQTPVCWYDASMITKEDTFPYRGKIWRENAAAVKTLAQILNIPQKVLKQAFSTWQGVRRRGEVRYKGEKCVVVDDFAHSPVKVSGSMKSLRDEYPKELLVAIYEPGDRSKESLENQEYEKCFIGADKVIIPHITTNDKEKKDFGRQLANVIMKGDVSVYYEEDDDKLLSMLEQLYEEAKKPVVFVFMSQRGFRGMIEELMSRLRMKNDSTSQAQQ